MAILPGRRLGPYEILSSIGAGGMGEVYRAKDFTLPRSHRCPQGSCLHILLTVLN